MSSGGHAGWQMLMMGMANPGAFKYEEDKRKAASLEEEQAQNALANANKPVAAATTVEEFNAASYERQMRKKAYLASIEGEGTIEKKSLLGG